MRRRELVVMLAAGMAAWPLVAPAEQSASPVIGFLHAASPSPIKDRLDAFRAGLKEGGYTEGQNVAIEYRWAEGDYDRLPSLARELVARPVSVLVSGTTVAAVAAKAASSVIPMVFTGVGGDPVKLGLVAGLNRPGGNMTGIAMLTVDLGGKRLELLSQLVPNASVIGFLVNLNNPNVGVTLQRMPNAARAMGKELIVVSAGNNADLETAIAAAVQKGAGALMVDADPFFFSQREKLVALVERYKLPAIYEFRDYAEIGGLVSYAPDAADLYRQAGVYVTRILKGERPAELPVVQPVKFEFVINLKTAKTLGLSVSPSLIARADQVIE
jgi:putative tryptophan/tyrosine transport system substrate-binding protein